MNAVRLGVTPCAVLDCESTGLSPSRDRVVELAVVRLAPDGELVSTWDSLVDPERDPGPTHAHGLTSADLHGAPVFADIAPELAEQLDGAVVCAHNVNFDSSFLRYEFWRLGYFAPRYPLLDTVRAAYRLGRIAPGGSRRLDHLCAQEGIRIQGAHSALGDATATAALVRVYLHLAAARGWDFADLAVAPLALGESSVTEPCTETKAVRRRAT